MSLANMIRRMAEAGAPPEAIAIAVEEIEGLQTMLNARRVADRDRKRAQREREKTANVTGQSKDSHGTVTGQTPSPSPEVSPQTPLPTPTHTPESITTRARGCGFQPPNGVSFEQFSAFCKQRKKKLTDRAYTLLCNKLKDLEDAGYPPGEMIDLAIERGWETVFEPKEYRSGQRTDSIRGTRPDPALDMWLQAQRERAAAENSRAGGGTWPALPPGQSG